MVEELNRFPLLRRAGAYSVNKKSPQASMAALKFSVETIGDLNNFLYIFPQGIIMPPNYRPIIFQTGLAYIAQNAGQNGDFVVQKVKEADKGIGYDASNNSFVNVVEKGIIDPTKVCRIALESAVSISSMILTINGAICQKETRES